MRAAIIVNGKVDNVVEVEALDVIQGMMLVEAPDASIGDFWDGSTFTRPTPPPVVPTVPQSVTRRQARQALLLAGLLDRVQPAIDSITDPVQKGMAQIEWDDATDYDRNRPVLLQIGAAIGLDSAGLDNLFIQAAQL